MNKQQPAGKVPQLSPRQALYIKMAIDQYHRLYLPAATEKGLKKISEADYVVLALKNYDDFNVHIEQCKLFGHDMRTEYIDKLELTACTRCGATEQLAELLLKANGLTDESTGSTIINP